MANNHTTQYMAQMADNFCSLVDRFDGSRVEQWLVEMAQLLPRLHDAVNALFDLLTDRLGQRDRAPRSLTGHGDAQRHRLTVGALPLRPDDGTPQAVRALHFHEGRLYAALVEGGFVRSGVIRVFRKRMRGFQDACRHGQKG